MSIVSWKVGEWEFGGMVGGGMGVAILFTWHSAGVHKRVSPVSINIGDLYRAPYPVA